MSLTMWPRNDGSSTPSIVSVADERGLANWPAMRPTFTVGHAGRVGEHDGHLQDDLQLVADGVGARTRRRTRRSRRPAAGTPRPSATSAERGGEVAGLAGEHQRRQRRQLLEDRARARPRRASRGCWAAGRSRQEVGVQVVERHASRAKRGRVGRSASAKRFARASAGGTSGGVDAGDAASVADGVDRPLHQPAGGLGGDAELLADLAVAALAAVVEAEALLDREAGPGRRARRAGR